MSSPSIPYLIPWDAPLLASAPVEVRGRAIPMERLTRTILRRTDPEPHVTQALLRRLRGRVLDEPGIRVQPDDLTRVGRHAEREATVTTAEIEHPFAAHDPRPAGRPRS